MSKSRQGNCFVCLDNSKDKVCSRCECYAHPKCWGEYLRNIMEVITLVYPYHYVMLFQKNVTCPICTNPISNLKPTTRSDTQSGRLEFICVAVKTLLNDLKLTVDPNIRRLINKSLFDLLLSNKHMLTLPKVKNMMSCNSLQMDIKNHLKYLYESEDWDSANIYHMRLFGEQIV